MSMYFVSRKYEIYDFSNILHFTVIQNGSLREPSIYRLEDAEAAFMVDSDVIAVKTRNAFIFPLWTCALCGQGQPNEEGIVIDTAIVPNNARVDKIYLSELNQTFSNFIYSHPKRVKVDEAVLTGGTVAISTIIEGKSYDSDPERVKKVLAKYKNGNYSCFA